MHAKNRGRALALILAAAVLPAAVLGARAAGSGSVRTRLDTFDAAIPGTVPSGWTEVGAPGYRVLPDPSAPSAPETIGAPVPATGTVTRGAIYNGAARNVIVQTSVLLRTTGGDRGPAVFVRATSALTTGYVAQVRPSSGKLVLERRVAGQAPVTLGFTALPSTGAWQTVALETYGNAIRAKIWNGTAEPGWQIDVTDPTVNGFGYVGVGDDGADARFDNIAQYNPVAGTISAGTMASDGIPRAVAVTLTDDGKPATGRTVSLTSSRGSTVDTIAPASAVIDAAGKASFTIASSTAGTAVLTLNVDGAAVSVTASIVFTGILPPVGTTYRTTFDGPAGSLPAGWSQRALTGTPVFAMAASGGVDPSPGLLADSSTASREYAYYTTNSFMDGAFESHAVYPTTVTHANKAFGVAARMTPDATTMYMAFVYLDPTTADTSRRTVTIVRRLNGVETVIASNQTRSPARGQWIRMKFEVTGTSTVSLRVKVWPRYDPEPSSWLITTADGAAPITTPGLAGVFALGGGALFDNFTVSTPSDALRTDQLVKQGSSTNAFSVIVNPVRGTDLARGNTLAAQPGYAGYSDGSSGTEHLDFAAKEAAATSEFALPATWLARYDALKEASYLTFLHGRPSTDEIGVYLEVTPKWAADAGVTYHAHANGSWTDASSLFLTGYTPAERTKLIDTAMTAFHAEFGVFPATVGAFWVDAQSLSYMRATYGITNAMTVSENVCTDGYTGWGGYFDHPFYPTLTNARMPAKTASDKLDVLQWPWAMMDPLNGYRSVFYASVPNNYLASNALSCNPAPVKLDTSYFAQQADLFTDSTANTYGWFMAGLENAYKWDTYGAEYRRQIEVLRDRAENGWLQVVTTAQFASWYRSAFPLTSPAQSILERTDWTGAGENVLWYYSPQYRARVVWSATRAIVEDLRAYDTAVAEPYLTMPIPGHSFSVTLPYLTDTRLYGTSLRGAGASGNDSGSASVGNVVVTRTAGRAQIDWDSVAGHTTIQFAPDGFTVRRSAASGLVSEDALIPSAAPHDWLGSLSTSATPADPQVLVNQTLAGAKAAVFLGSLAGGVRGGASFWLTANVGGSSAAVMQAGAGTLTEVPMKLNPDGSAAPVLEFIVAPGTTNTWRARLTLAQQNPALFR
jgi:hypothetical protein